MNVSFDKIDNVTGKVSISIEEKDYSDKVNSELKKIGNSHKIDGFRKGHVPLGILKKMFGKNVLVDTINRETYDALLKCIDENKLKTEMLANAKNPKKKTGFMARLEEAQRLQQEQVKRQQQQKNKRK